jgi:ATP-dependent Clp protease ATP-binding subunit ClpB
MGSQIIRENIQQAQDKGQTAKEQIMEQTKNEVMDLLKKTIRPEFLNRIDETIMFTPLDESEIKAIVELQLANVKKLLAENGVELQFTEAAINLIAEEGFDPQYGARPVKRVIQQQVLNPLSKDILAGKINQGKPIVVDEVERLLRFSN